MIHTMATLQLVKGMVKFPAQQPRNYGYGERINVVVSLSDGEEIRLWGKPGDPIGELSKGQPVTLAYDGKSYKLADSAPTAPDRSSATVPSAGMTPDTKRAIASYVEDLAALYVFCFDTAAAKLSDRIQDADAIKDVATTLFLSACRKFNLQ
jgi:hypothetical protein